ALREGKRPPHPAPRSWRSRAAPLVGTGWRGLLKVICPTTQTQNLLRQDWTGRIALIAQQKSAFTRNLFRVTRQRQNMAHRSYSVENGANEQVPGTYGEASNQKSSRQALQQRP